MRNFLYPLLFSGKLSFGSSSETSISALSVFVRSISSYHLVITHQLKCNCRGLTGLSTGINQTIVLQRTVTMLTMINPTPTGERSTFFSKYFILRHRSSPDQHRIAFFSVLSYFDVGFLPQTCCTFCCPPIGRERQILNTSANESSVSA